MNRTNSTISPRVGMLATVRNRRGLVASVEPFDGRDDGRLHLVRLEYIDSTTPHEDTLIWEREVHPTLLEPTALPQVATAPPMPGADFDALQRATRWTALSPFLPIDEAATIAQLPIASPFFGAVQVEGFQMLPLLKALQMPRISLLLADDVGLGKTVEAGLILSELLLRRRIQRVLILCPAALRIQWQQEMKSKFALNFDIVDRHETHTLQKRLGLDANPWRTYPRIITSYHYLRQPDVLEQFRAACRQPEGVVQLPWDVLIVDEAHNLMPSNFGEDSDLSKMLRYLSPWIDDSLRLELLSAGYRGALPSIVFDPHHFIQMRNGRPVYRTAKDTALLHLGHPLFQHALAMFARARFPGGGDGETATRWTVRYGEVPENADALLLLTVEELAVNELREPFHHWVRTVRFPVKDGLLGDPLPHLPAGEERPSERQIDTTAIQGAQGLWDELSPDVRDLLRQLETELTDQMKVRLEASGHLALSDEKARFRLRLREVERAMRETTLQKLERERDKLLLELQQGFLFPQYTRQKQDELRDLDDELRRRRSHYQDLLEQLKVEQNRVLERMLPKRYNLRGQARVFPVTVEIRLPEGG